MVALLSQLFRGRVGASSITAMWFVISPVSLRWTASAFMFIKMTFKNILLWHRLSYFFISSYRCWIYALPPSFLILEFYLRLSSNIKLWHLWRRKIRHAVNRKSSQQNRGEKETQNVFHSLPAMNTKQCSRHKKQLRFTNLNFKTPLQSC